MTKKKDNGISLYVLTARPEDLGRTISAIYKSSAKKEPHPILDGFFSCALYHIRSKLSRLVIGEVILYNKNRKRY